MEARAWLPSSLPLSPSFPSSLGSKTTGLTTRGGGTSPLQLLIQHPRSSAFKVLEKAILKGEEASS